MAALLFIQYTFCDSSKPTMIYSSLTRQSFGFLVFFNLSLDYIREVEGGEKEYEAVITDTGV